MRNVVVLLGALLALPAGAAEPPPAPDIASASAIASGPPLSIVPAVAAPPLQFETFEDGETRIMLIPRDGDPNCRAAGPARLGQDLRSVVFLDPADVQDCYGPARRRIETYAGSGGDPAADQCLGPQALCATLVDRLRLPKHRSRAVFRSDGWVDVTIVTKGDPALAAAPLRYTFVLHTDQSHLTVDLRALTTTLNAVVAP